MVCYRERWADNRFPILPGVTICSAPSPPAPLCSITVRSIGCQVKPRAMHLPLGRYYWSQMSDSARQQRDPAGSKSSVRWIQSTGNYIIAYRCDRCHNLSPLPPTSYPLGRVARAPRTGGPLTIRGRAGCARAAAGGCAGGRRWAHWRCWGRRHTCTSASGRCSWPGLLLAAETAAGCRWLHN